MAIARLSLDVDEAVSLYTTVGLGVIEVEYDAKNFFPAFSGSANTAGGQVSLGAAYDFSSRVCAFGEMTMQTAFEDPAIKNRDVEHNMTGFVLGVGAKF